MPPVAILCATARPMPLPPPVTIATRLNFASLVASCGASLLRHGFSIDYER
jgi:hypothetical protein